MLTLLCLILDLYSNLKPENERIAVVCTCVLDAALLMLTAALHAAGKIHIQLN